VVDAQSGHEKTITGMLPALAGANVIYGLGMLEMGITFDLAQLVLDNEIAEITDLSESQVKVYIYRGRLTLKKYLVSIEALV